MRKMKKVLSLAMTLHDSQSSDRHRSSAQLLRRNRTMEKNELLLY